MSKYRRFEGANPHLSHTITGSREQAGSSSSLVTETVTDTVADTETVTDTVTVTYTATETVTYTDTDTVTDTATATATVTDAVIVTVTDAVTDTGNSNQRFRDCQPHILVFFFFSQSVERKPFALTHNTHAPV